MAELRPYQQQLVEDNERAWAEGHQNVLMQLATGGGKCLGRGTPVLMYDGGVKAVEDVVAGDSVMGPDSLPRRVTATCAGREELWRVTPVKGDPYVVNASHILSLKRTGRRKGDPRAGEVVNMNVVEFARSRKFFRHVHKGWRAGVDFPPLPAPHPDLPPWMLGVWLGDGTSLLPSITTADAEIEAGIRAYAEQRGLRVRKDQKPGNAAATYHVVGSGGRENPLTRALRHYSLIGNKHVPAAYLRGPREVRMQVLAGLLDSDGYLHHGGYDAVFVVRQLALDLAFLARSLGFAAYVKRCRKGCQTGAVGTYWRVGISGHGLERIPTRVPRLKAPPRAQKKDPLRVGLTVEPIGEGDYFGFELEGPDRLFLLGDFTVTHNTVVLGEHVARNTSGLSLLMAHRQELVGQLSLHLAREGIYHDVLAPTAVRRDIVRGQMELYGRSYVTSGASAWVAGVNTLASRGAPAWMRGVSLVIPDESHHVLARNVWGKAMRMAPATARGLLPTATPCRADGLGLGRHADGLADVMTLGPPQRWLIDNGFLSDYRLVCPDESIREVVPVGATGDFKERELRAASHRSSIVGDGVGHYLRWTPGKLCIAYTVDVETAEEAASRFRAEGVTAEVISAKTPTSLRAHLMRQFRERRILVLVNCDTLSEGVDVPGVEVVLDMAPTQSFARYSQRFGRMLRPAPGKAHGWYLDPAGNVMRNNGPPDWRTHWTLDAAERRGKSEPSLVKRCANPVCLQAYPRELPACPYCGEAPVAAARGGPELVDGDLTLVDPAWLAERAREIARIHGPPRLPPNLSGPARVAATRHHEARREAQEALRHAADVWAALQDVPLPVAYRRFCLTFGVDMATAQTLNARDAEALRARIESRIVADGYVITGATQ